MSNRKIWMYIRYNLTWKYFFPLINWSSNFCVCWIDECHYWMCVKLEMREIYLNLINIYLLYRFLQIMKEKGYLYYRVDI